MKLFVLVVSVFLKNINSLIQTLVYIRLIHSRNSKKITDIRREVSERLTFVGLAVSNSLL